MEREKVNWEKYSDSEASLVFSREAVRIIVKEIVEITLKSPYETSVTLQSGAKGSYIELKKKDMEIAFNVYKDGEVFGTLKAHSCGEMELPLVSIEPFEDYDRALLRIHSSAVCLIGAFVRYDIRRFFDFISSYDGEWYNWMECIDLYEEYCTPRG